MLATYSERTEGLLDGRNKPLQLGAAGQHQRQPRAALAGLAHAPLLDINGKKALSDLY